MPLSLIYCGCCGSLISGLTEDNCPRCAYPIQPEKEQQFLESSLQSLQRVVTYGGADITVPQLIERYTMRLQWLHELKVAPTVQTIQRPLPFKTLASVEMKDAAPASVEPPVAPPPTIAP